MPKRFLSRVNYFLIMAIVGLLSNFVPIIASAQTVPAPAPYVGGYFDANGVDLLTGAEKITTGMVSIGSGADGLSASVTSDFSLENPEHRDSLFGAINYYSGRGYVVSFGEAAEEFTLSGSVYTPKRANGTTLSLSGGIYTYTLSDGTIALFDTAIKTINITEGIEANTAMVTSITSPSGKTLTYEYDVDVNGSSTAIHLRSVQNNLGYQLKYTNLGKSVTAINNYIDYCSPTAPTCSLPIGRWADANFAPPSGSVGEIQEFTNASGEIRVVDIPQITETSGETTTYTHSTVQQGSVLLRRVITARNGGGTWTYGYSEANGIRTVTVTAPDGGTRVVTSNIAERTVISDKDALNRTTSFEYDSNQRVTKITEPYTTSTEYTYDSRGNVTQIKQNPKAGSSNVSIITTASYPATCTNSKTCNKPIWTKDARGKQTDYTYSGTHGGVLTVTGPAPSSGATRPQIRYTYAQRIAKAKNSAGTLVNLSPVWRMTAASTCGVGSSCNGTASETDIFQSYSVRNLMPYFRTTRSGDLSIVSITKSWQDWYGNPEYVDGPLAGTDDRVFYRYDNSRRLLGMIGPDPDGTGPRLRQAVRYTYSDGQITVTESGTTNGTSTSAWNAFVPLQATETEYDSVGRPIKNMLTVGGNIYSVSQTSYDTKSRPTCSALRMNPNTFTSLPADACTHATAGVFGADRIAKLEYNLTDQVLKSTAGYGTSEASTEENVYYSNGNVQYRDDGNDNRTKYSYDPFNRLQFQYYPNTTGSGHNASDYQRYYYDQYGRAYQTRQRDGSLILSSFDDLGRTTLIDAPGTADDVSFTYDNLGRVLTTTQDGDTITNVYDALSRRLSETTANGTVSYEYDLAGRGTKIIYPGSGLYVNYDYNVAGQVTAIRENGATSGIGLLAEYTYNDQGRRTNITRGNGVDTNLGFDVLSRLTSLENDVAGTADDQTLTFTHIASNQIATRANSNSAYDWDGSSILSESFNINGLNQVLSAAIGNITYDARGNTVAAGSKTYGYDIFNQLTSAVGSGVNASMDYDPVGRLSEVTGSGVTTKFVYSGSQMIAETNSSGATLRRYVHGPGVDEPIVWYEGSGTTDRRWLMSDNQGSITAITNASGTVTSKNRYNEYGVPDLNNTGRFQYTGQVWLAEADIYHYKARAYDPYLGRFLQTDPIGYAAGMNMYAYVGGDPVNRIDPTGLKDEVISTGTRRICQGTCITDPFDIQRFMRENSTLLGSLTGAMESMMTGIGSAIGDFVENQKCADIIAAMVAHLNEQVPKRGATDPFVHVQIAPSWDDLPQDIQDYGWSQSYYNARGDFRAAQPHPIINAGHHDRNARLPGSPGGFHITVDNGRQGVWAHWDAESPVNGVGSLWNHGREVDFPTGKNAPPSIWTNADGNLNEASQSFDQYCGK